MEGLADSTAHERCCATSHTCCRGHENHSSHTSMTPSDPLPFRLKLRGEDTINTEGVRSVSYRVAGLLHLSDVVLALEWRATRHTEEVSYAGIKDEVDESPVGSIEVPRDAVARARVSGGWWRPRLQVWARRFDAFDGVPGARLGMVTLRIRRMDRDHAKAIARALNDWE